MRIITRLISVTLILCMSCNSAPTNKLQKIISDYIKGNVKNPKSYNPIYFYKVDTTDESLYKDSFLQAQKPDYKYEVKHVYEINNLNNEKVIMTTYFEFDTASKLIRTVPDGLDGDYGQFTGNVYWKYNNYVGNKPDPGSKVTLYSTDTLRKNLKYEVTCDVQGNFKFDKVLEGFYLVIVNSENTTSSPEDVLQTLTIYNDYLKNLFGYDINKTNQSELKQYGILDSIYEAELTGNDKAYGGFNKRRLAYTITENEKIKIAESIINKFPKSFIELIGIGGVYSKKIDISTEKIDEGKTTNKVVDFGNTYY